MVFGMQDWTRRLKALRIWRLGCILYMVLCVSTLCLNVEHHSDTDIHCFAFLTCGFSWRLFLESLINKCAESTWGEMWMFLTRLWTSFSVLLDKSLLAFMDLDQLSLVYKGFDYNWCFSSSFVTQCFVVKRFFTLLCWQAIRSLHLSFDYSFVQII